MRTSRAISTFIAALALAAGHLSGAASANAADPQGAQILFSNFCSQVPRLGDYCVDTRTVLTYRATPSGQAIQHEVTSGTFTLLGTGIFPRQVAEVRSVLFVRTDNSVRELMFTLSRSTVTYDSQTCEVFEHYRLVDEELVYERVTTECQPNT